MGPALGPILLYVHSGGPTRDTPREGQSSLVLYVYIYIYIYILPLVLYAQKGVPQPHCRIFLTTTVAEGSSKTQKTLISLQIARDPPNPAPFIQGAPWAPSRVGPSGPLIRPTFPAATRFMPKQTHLKLDLHPFWGIFPLFLPFWGRFLTKSLVLSLAL